MKETEKILKGTDTEGKMQALGSLRGAGDDPSMEVLLESLKDHSWRIRKTAAEILRADFAAGRYIPGLLDLLGMEDNAGARNGGIDLLVSLGKEAIPYLIRAFETDNRDVRKFIIDIIGEISDRRALPLLLDALNDKDENVRASAVEHLGKLREPSVVDSLISILQSGDVWTAYPAADALGRIRDRKAVPFLVEALGNKTLREPVLKSLACFADPDSLDKIVPLLVSGSKSIREETLRTLNEFYRKGVSEEVIAEKILLHLGGSALDFLMPYAWTSKSDVRVSAILLLGFLRDSRAVRPLLDMSSEEDFREEIKRALVFIGRNNPDDILKLFGDSTTAQRRFITEIVVEIGAPGFFGLFSGLLCDEDGHVRALAAAGLGRIGKAGAVDALFSLLDDKYADVQEAAVEALFRLGKAVPAERLTAGLSDPSPSVRKNSAILLGRKGETGVMNSLGFLIKDPGVEVRKAAVSAISMLADGQTIRFLIMALTDEVPAIRISAAYALGKTGAAEATDSLVLLLSDQEESVRVAAAKALGLAPDERSVDALIKALDDPNGFVVAAAIETLGKMKTSKSEDAITRMLSNPDEEIKRTAISSLADFRGVRERISPFLADPDWATRKTAVEVLGKQEDPSVIRLLEEIYDREEDPSVKRTIEGVLSAYR